MIAGIYRLRFRVANPKNAGVKGAWARIHQNNREAFELVQNIRTANKLPPLTPQWSTTRIYATDSKENRSLLQGNGTNQAVDNVLV